MQCLIEQTDGVWRYIPNPFVIGEMSWTPGDIKQPKSVCTSHLKNISLMDKRKKIALASINIGD